MNHLPPRAIRTQKIPRLRTKPRRATAIKCRAHTNWVKNAEIWQCVAIKSQECYGPLDPHHVIPRSRGGGDEQVVTVCRRHHDICHAIGTEEFDARYGTDIATTAADLWQLSPAGKAYRRNATKAMQVGTSEEAETLAAKTPKTDGDE